MSTLHIYLVDMEENKADLAFCLRFYPSNGLNSTTSVLLGEIAEQTVFFTLVWQPVEEKENSNLFKSALTLTF